MIRASRDSINGSRTLAMRGWSYFLLAVLLAPTSANSLSCGDTQHTLSEAYESADSIIVGLVTDCKEEVSSEWWVEGSAGCYFTDLEVQRRPGARDIVSHGNAS